MTRRSAIRAAAVAVLAASLLIATRCEFRSTDTPPSTTVEPAPTSSTLIPAPADPVFGEAEPASIVGPLPVEYEAKIVAADRPAPGQVRALFLMGPCDALSRVETIPSPDSTAVKVWLGNAVDADTPISELDRCGDVTDYVITVADGTESVAPVTFTAT